MRNIRYICLSDLHLGEEDSLLTNVADPSRPSPVLRSLAECLGELLRYNHPVSPKPTLILAGDVLELALGPTQQALTVFEQFLWSVMPANGKLFGEIVYIPGNHDHHMWQAAREAQYLNYLGRLAPGEAIEPPWDTTKVVMDFAGVDHLASGALTAAARRLPHLRELGFEVLAAYPNFAIHRDGRAVVFTHGHFIEPAYRLFSTLASLFFPEQKQPEDIYTLERENSAWIDFFWSTMGSCGRIGPDVESIYEASGDDTSLRRLTDTLAHSIAVQYPLPKWVPRVAREWVLGEVLHALAGTISTGLERRLASTDQTLGDESRKGAHWYLDEMLRRQFQQETGSVPEALTFVFGHTHKPFAERWGSTSVLNTGGWVIDAPQAQPLHGASAVIVGEDLSSIGLHLYREGAYQACVEEPVAEGSAHSELYGHVSTVLKGQPQPWRQLGEVTRIEADLRMAALAARLNLRAKAAAAR